jgi:hypothetical protein
MQNKNRPHQVSYWEIAEMAIDALWQNKLRSGLTMLGVIIGISSAIVRTVFLCQRAVLEKALVVRMGFNQC